MPVDYLKTGRRWLALIPIAIIVISVAVWFTTRDTLPGTIRIATAHDGGLYHEFGTALQKSLEERTGREVVLITSEGSIENAKLLREGKVDFAIIQGGSTGIDELAAIAPLHPETVHIVARRSAEIKSMNDLWAKHVLQGSRNSGMQASARRVLKHLGISSESDLSQNSYFTQMRDDESIDAAIVTTGFMNQDLHGMLATGDFELIPMTGAEALATKDPYFHVAKIPRELYRKLPPIPLNDTPTIATTALLVANEDESERLIESVMESIYDENLGLKFPTLISRNEAIAKSPVTLHSISRSFFNPPDHIGRLAQVMDSLAAFKELTVALAAGLYLLWTRRKRLKEARQSEFIQQQKDKLDEFLEKTLEIERAQMHCYDHEELHQFLDHVTEIKLQALTKLTHEELRSDQAFSIFLLQCANLINKIQLKILTCLPKS